MIKTPGEYCPGNTHHPKKSPSHSVGARVVRRGGEDLDGRPRPVPLAHSLEEHDRLPTHGRPSRPTHPLPAALAPTDRPASCLTSQLSLMRIPWEYCPGRFDHD